MTRLRWYKFEDFFLDDLFYVWNKCLDEQTNYESFGGRCATKAAQKRVSLWSMIGLIYARTRQFRYRSSANKYSVLHLVHNIWHVMYRSRRSSLCKSCFLRFFFRFCFNVLQMSWPKQAKTRRWGKFLISTKLICMKESTKTSKLLVFSFDVLVQRLFDRKNMFNDGTKSASTFSLVKYVCFVKHTSLL